MPTLNEEEPNDSEMWNLFTENDEDEDEFWDGDEEDEVYYTDDDW